MYDIDMSSIPGIWTSFWSVAAGALRLESAAFVAVVDEDGGVLLAWMIVLVAGVSFMIGQSVVLLANRVSRRRFAISLVVGAFALVAEIRLWAVSAWVVGVLLLGRRPQLLDALTLVWLSHAPLLFGFLVLLPYLGIAIEKAMQIWILLAIVVAIHAVYQSGFWTSLACAAIGWIAMQVIFLLSGLTWLGTSRMQQIGLGQCYLARMGQWIERMREKVPNNVFDVLIIVRNALQVGVSADPRYGPIYNRGVAHEIIKSLHRQGYPAEGGHPISLVGYSGGVQVAIGAAPYLQRALRASLHVISIGGVMSSDPAIRFVERIDHLKGSKDPLPPLGVALYPGRWPITVHSDWNRARRTGKVTTTTIGPVKHFGSEDYFSDSARLPNGQTYLDQTVELVATHVMGAKDTHRST